MPAGRSGCRYRRSPGLTSCFLFVFVIPVSSFFRPVFSFPVRYHIEDMRNVDAMVSRQRCRSRFIRFIRVVRCPSGTIWRTARASDKAGMENVRVVPPAHRNETRSRSHACACAVSTCRIPCGLVCAFQPCRPPLCFLAQNSRLKPRCVPSRRVLSSRYEVEFAETGGKGPFCTSEVNDLFFFPRVTVFGPALRQHGFEPQEDTQQGAKRDQIFGTGFVLDHQCVGVGGRAGPSRAACRRNSRRSTR